MTNSNLKADLSFLLSLQKQDIVLHTEGDELVCDAPEGTLTPEIKEQILQHRAGLIKMLNSIGQDSDLPHVKADPDAAFEPFPLTENQEAYWLGRNESLESGGVGVHLFFELEFKNLDKDKLQKAWNAVVQRHEMLRVVVLPEGKQHILPDCEEVSIEEEFLTDKTDDEIETILADARLEVSHICYDLFEWPQFTLKVYHLSDKDGEHISVLMFSLDAWALDLRSLQIMMDDLVDFYKGNDLFLLPSVSFRDYVMALQKMHASPVYENSLKYWHKRIERLPPAPVLPLRQQSDKIQERHFTRRFKKLDKELWGRIDSLIKSKGLSTASVLLTCYASALSKWSETKHFTLNIPRYNRLPMHKDINNIVGEFASFSLLEVDNRECLSFEDLAKQIQRQLWADLEHTHVSGVRVLRDWKKSLGSAHPSVMAPFVFTNEPEYDAESEEGTDRRKHSWRGAMECLGTMCNVLTQTPQVWLDSQYTEISGELYISWDSLDYMFEEGLTDSMFEAYSTLLQSLDRENAWQLTELPLPADEAPLRSILTGPVDPMPKTTPWEALQKRSEDNPHGLAIADAEGTMNWRQVCEEVRLLTEKFRNLGLPTKEVFAFALPKGCKQFIASMAIHAYDSIVVPLDHESPNVRLSAILDECRASVLLTDAGSYPRLSALSVPVFNLDMPDVPPSLPVGPASGHFTDPLYCMIFTSGSTGTPKGVMMPLDGLLNMAQDAGKRFGLGENDTILCLNPIYHDFSLFDIMVSALLGIPLVFPDPARLRDPGHWLDLMHQYKVSVWATVPATMTMLLDYWESSEGAEETEDLRYAIQGGDWIPLETPVRLEVMAPKAQVVSIGGPTEVSVWNLLYPVEEMNNKWRSIPYGYPIRNAAYHILDDKLEDCPAMVTGEMYCSGSGVTFGYANDEEKTNAAFFVHPTKNIHMFKTGDLGRLHKNGYIEFIGRRDNQVNINGYRIELGELEATAGRHPSISQAVAVAAKGPGRVDVLAVWAVSKPGMKISAEELKEDLKAHLPKYMLPSYVGIVDELPLSQSNKIDRLIIARWELPESGAGQEGELPETPVEKELAVAWKELLGRDTVLLDQNFFEIGGNSITAVRLFNQIMAGKYEDLSVATIFTYPTIRTLGQVMEAAKHIADNSVSSTSGDDGMADAVDQRDNQAWPDLEPLPLRPPVAPATRIQQRIFYQNRDMQDSGSYNLSMCVAVSADNDRILDADRLCGAFNTVVAHHEILRTTFQSTNTAECAGQISVMQHIVSDLELPLEICDLNALDNATREDKESEFCREFTQRPYNLEEGPLVRVALALEGNSHGHMIIGFHHIVLDGWSMALLLEDFVAALEGKELPPNTLQQVDIAAWENSQGFVKAAGNLLPAAAERLAKQDTPSVLPSVVSLNEQAPVQEGEAPVVDRNFPPEIMEAVTLMCSKTGCTPFAIFYTAFGLLSAEYNYSDSAQVGTYVAARTLQGMEKVLGSMVSPTPIQLSFEWEMTFLEAVKKTMSVTSRAIDGVLLPFEDLVRLAAPPRTGAHPFFGMAFSSDNTPTQEYTAAGMRLNPLGIQQYRTSIDFEAAVALGEDKARMCIVFNPQKVRKKVTEDFVSRFFTLLEKACREPEQPLASMSPMTSDDSKVIDSWNNIQKPFTEQKNLGSLFRDIVANKPNATAVVEVAATNKTPQKLASYTYADLGLLADSITATLLSHGVNPGDHVALPMSRGALFIAGLIAVQQCGAVATPIPVTTPEHQIHDMLDALESCFICCETSQEAELSVRSGMLFLDDVSLLSPEEQQELHSSGQLISPSTEADACLIFTSGSEGKPKGVRLTHGNWVQRLNAGWNALPYDTDEACLAKTSIGFVDAFSEIFQPLLKGVPLYVMPGDEDNNVESLVRHMKQWNITRVTAVASLIQAILDYCQSSGVKLSNLKTVVATGEPLTLGIVKQFYELQPQSELHNFYGSTEMTGDVVCGPVTWTNGADHAAVPIGRPMGNVQIAIVNPAFTPLPPGMPGQIAVAGPSVTPGYADGDLSRFFTIGGERYFASGDLGMWTDNGELLCFGRLDRQIKIRGQRIEPGAVEESIRKTNMVAEVAVFAVGKEPEQTLATCYVPMDMYVTPTDLRAAVRPLLSQATMPSVFKDISAIPKNRNGKTDVLAMQNLVQEFLASSASTPLELQTDTEKKLVEVWSTLTGSPLPGRNANFFACGGHSLSAARLTALLREQFHVPLRVKDIFDTPEFADQAELIDLLSDTAQESNDVPGSGTTEVTL